MPQPKQMIQFDNLDDRRELHRLLLRLPPRRKLEFLRWACQQASLTPGCTTKPQPGHETVELARRAMQRPGDETLNERLSLEIFYDVFALASQWEFSLDAAARELERWGRKE